MKSRNLIVSVDALMFFFKHKLIFTKTQFCSIPQKNELFIFFGYKHKIQQINKLSKISPQTEDENKFEINLEHIDVFNA